MASWPQQGPMQGDSSREDWHTWVILYLGSYAGGFQQWGLTHWCNMYYNWSTVQGYSSRGLTHLGNTKSWVLCRGIPAADWQTWVRVYKGSYAGVFQQGGLTHSGNTISGVLCRGIPAERTGTLGWEYIWGPMQGDSGREDRHTGVNCTIPDVLCRGVQQGRRTHRVNTLTGVPCMEIPAGRTDTLG
jgi:hypothetical protein